MQELDTKRGFISSEHIFAYKISFGYCFSRSLLPGYLIGFQRCVCFIFLSAAFAAIIWFIFLFIFNSILNRLNKTCYLIINVLQ